MSLQSANIGITGQWPVVTWTFVTDFNVYTFYPMLKTYALIWLVLVN